MIKMIDLDTMPVSEMMEVISSNKAEIARRNEQNKEVHMKLVEKLTGYKVGAKYYNNFHRTECTILEIKEPRCYPNNIVSVDNILETTVVVVDNVVKSFDPLKTHSQVYLKYLRKL